MGDHNRFSQAKRRPNRPQAQIVLPKNVAPSYQTEQFLGRWPANNRKRKAVAAFLASLSYNGDRVAQFRKLLRQQTTHCFNSTYARSEGM
jgi:hypothetical protein